MEHALPQDLLRLVELVEKHNRWRGSECLNMIASENVTSPLLNAVYLSDAMHRYAEGLPFKRYYQGTRYIDEIEVLACRLMSELFSAEYVDLRPTSGTLANAAAFYALGEPGATTMITPLPSGGHVSHSEYGIMGALGMKPVPLPFDAKEMNVDVPRAEQEIRRVKPKFVVLGASLILFYPPVRDIKRVAEEEGIPVVFDAAHILGLIAGGVLPNPLSEGADVVTSSTHKTFPGPQGGVVMTNDKAIAKRIKKTVFPVFVSNHHLHRLAATAVAALEMREFGQAYAEQTVKNAKALAEALYHRGFSVLAADKGFTETHQVVLDVRELGGGAKVAETLERANIIANKNMLPWDTPQDIKNPSGLRLGVQELTRLGMREGEMEQIAEFFERLLLRGEPPENVRSDVVRLREKFREVQYTFAVPSDLLERIAL